jgi:hypothetical protein
MSTINRPTTVLHSQRFHDHQAVKKPDALQHKWNDGFAAAGVVFKVFLVGSMFANSPNDHLVKASKGEQTG